MSAKLHWKQRTHQRVSFSVTGGHLLAGRPLPRHGVAVEANILGPELQERGPLVLLRAGCPRIGVHHPLGGILPGGPPSIQLETDKERVVRVSALVRNHSLPTWTTAHQGAWKAMPRGQWLGRPHSSTSALTEQTRPQEVQCVPQGTQPVGRELGAESRPDHTQDDQPRQHP